MTLRGKLFFSALILGFVGLAMFVWSFSADSEPKDLPRTFLKNRPNLTPDKTAYAESPTAKISEEIIQEAVKVGQIDRNPEATEHRLNQIAKNLRSDEIKSLAEVAKTPSNNGDLRAIAVDLLARNESEDALEPLEEIIFSHWEESRDVRLNELERVLRARAVEGLQINSSLDANAVLAKGSEHLEDEFLRDRSRRALLHRQGKVPKAEDQDQAALEKFLKR